MVNIHDLHDTNRSEQDDIFIIGRAASSHRTETKEHNASDVDHPTNKRKTECNEDEKFEVAVPVASKHSGFAHLSYEFYDFLRYVTFLCLFVFTVLGTRSSDAYFIKETMDRFFFENDFDFETSFTDIGSMGQFWVFMNSTLLPNLYPTINDGSGKPLSRKAKLFLADGTNFRVGLVRVRQIRMKSDLCSQSGIEEECFPGWAACFIDYSCNEEKSDYNPGVLHSLNTNSSRLWQWYSMKELGLPWLRTSTTGTKYPGEGYLEDLGAPTFGYSWAPTLFPTNSYQQDSDRPSSTPTHAPSIRYREPTSLPTLLPTSIEIGDRRAEVSWVAQQQLNTLRALDWIDRATRIVIVEFNVYNPNTEMFGSIRMSVEFTGTGTVIPSYSVVSAQLLKSLRVYRGLYNRDGASAAEIRFMYVEAFFYLFVLYYLKEEFKEWRKARTRLQKWKDSAKKGEGPEDNDLCNGSNSWEGEEALIGETIEDGFRLYRTEVGYTVSNVSRFLKQRSSHDTHQANQYENERPLGYFENGWNWIDMANLLLFLAVIVCRIWMLHGIAHVNFAKAMLNSRFYHEITNQIAFAKLTDQMNSINAILSFLKIFKYTTEHPQLGQFTKTLTTVVHDIAGFSIVFMIVLSGYSIAFHLAFGHDVEDYASFENSMLTLFTITLGDFDLDSITKSNYILGPFLFFSYIIVVLFIVMSMMLVFVDEAYSRVSEEAVKAEKQTQDPLSKDLTYIMEIPGRMIGCVSGILDNAIRVVESVAAGASLHPQPEEILMERKKIEAAQDVDRLMLSNDKFIMFAATFRKNIEHIYDLQEEMDSLESLLKMMDSKIRDAEFSIAEHDKAGTKTEAVISDF